MYMSIAPVSHFGLYIYGVGAASDSSKALKVPVSFKLATEQGSFKIMASGRDQADEKITFVWDILGHAEGDEGEQASFALLPSGHKSKLGLDQNGQLTLQVTPGFTSSSAVVVVVDDDIIMIISIIIISCSIITIIIA